MSAADLEAEHKLSIAKQKKDAGDQAFKAGEVTNALRSYHEAIMYLEGISKNAGNVPFSTGSDPVGQAAEPKQKTEAGEVLEKIYSNMAACHIKNSNWKRAAECADKALAKNDKNTKALFRKGKALGEMGYFERADKILSDLLTKDTSDGPAITAELERLRAIDKEREKKHNQKFRGFLNRDKATHTHPEQRAKAEGYEDSGRFELVDEPADAAVPHEVSDDD